VQAEGHGTSSNLGNAISQAGRLAGAAAGTGTQIGIANAEGDNNNTPGQEGVQGGQQLDPDLGKGNIVKGILEDE
jgi:hypothetical protein